MRTDRRKDRRREISGENNEGGSIKNALYITGTILALGVIAFFITVMVYNNSLEKVYTDLESQKLAERTDDEAGSNETEETSTNLGKTIEEMENVVQSTSVENEEETTANVETKKDTNNEVKEDKTNKTTVETQNQDKEVEVKQEEPKFSYPVDGEIMKAYAKDNLVYSETLKEW